MRHTKGPWIAREIDSAKMNIRTDQDTIATVYRMQGSPTLMDRAGEGDANARLIAAAPEMLDYLNATANILNDVARYKLSTDAREQLIDAELQIRALLARIDNKDETPSI